MFRNLFLSFLLISCVASVEAQQQPTPAPSPSKTQTPKAPLTVQTPQTPQPSQSNPTIAFQIKPRVFSVVQKLNGIEVLTLLKRSGADIKAVDSSFVFNFDFHTNIVAGFPLGDGKTVVTRLPQAEVTTWYFFSSSAPTPKPNPTVEVKSTAQTPSASVAATAPRAQPPNVLAGPQRPIIYSMPTPNAQLRAKPATKMTMPSNGMPMQPVPGPDGSIMVFAEDGRGLAAKFVGLDGWTGLSLLQVEGLQQTPPQLLPEADASKLVLEQSVRLIAPGPISQSVQLNTGKLALKLDEIRGKLKTLERNSTGEIKLITVTANDISPAVVGGIVINDMGEAIGMIQTVSSQEAKVIPVADIKQAATRIRSQAALAPRPWLGARGEAIATSSLEQLLLAGWNKEQAQHLLAMRRGVLLTSIPPETPAALAQLKVGDVVLGVNQAQVANADDFTTLLSQGVTGQDLLFTVIGPNSVMERKLKVKLGETPDPMLAMVRAENLARRLRSKDLFTRLGMDTVPLAPNPLDKKQSFKRGRLVFQIYPESAAAKAGLQAGDLIEAINGKRLFGPGILIANQISEITLTVVRNEQKLTIKINLNEEEKK